MHIDLNELPVQTLTPRQLLFTPEEEQATNHLIQEMLAKKAIQRTVHELGDFVSTIFLHRRSNEKFV